MRISVIQMDMVLNDPKGNFKKAKALIEKSMASKPDVIVLPETWNTGFSPKDVRPELCDKDGEAVKAEIGGLAKALGINIVAGSVANRKGGGLYNTAYVFDRGGACVAEYDKTHLFSPMGEDRVFCKGDHTVGFALDGHPCTLIICYDVRFPELVRTVTANQKTDILFMVSQWPAVRVPHLRALVTARAIENQMFAVCCNSCGRAGDTKYGGNSMIVDPWGETLAAAAEGEEILTADVDPGVLSGIRSSINVFADRRPALYKVN